MHPRWAAEQAALGAFANAGQIWVSVERIYVVDSVADAFIAALVTEAREWAERIGPLVDNRQREQVHRHVADAVKRGARVLIGGELPPGPGSYYPPTVLTDCTADMLVFGEETFGPIVSVRVVPDFATALTEVAEDRYGLADGAHDRHGSCPECVADIARGHRQDKRRVRRGARGSIRAAAGQRQRVRIRPGTARSSGSSIAWMRL